MRVKNLNRSLEKISNVGEKNNYHLSVGEKITITYLSEKKITNTYLSEKKITIPYLSEQGPYQVRNSFFLTDLCLIGYKARIGSDKVTIFSPSPTSPRQQHCCSSETLQSHKLVVNCGEVTQEIRISLLLFGQKYLRQIDQFIIPWKYNTLRQIFVYIYNLFTKITVFSFRSEIII